MPFLRPIYAYLYLFKKIYNLYQFRRVSYFHYCFWQLHCMELSRLSYTYLKGIIIIYTYFVEYCIFSLKSHLTVGHSSCSIPVGRATSWPSLCLVHIPQKLSLIKEEKQRKAEKGEDNETE